MPNWESDARFVVAAFRADTARAGMAGNVKALSPEFEAMWRDNDSHHAVITKAWTIADGRVSQQPVPAQDSKSLKNNRDFCVGAIPSWDDHDSFCPRFPALLPCPRVEDKSCRRWLRRDRYNGVAGAFAAVYFAVLPSVLRSRSLHFQAEIVRLPPKSVP